MSNSVKLKSMVDELDLEIVNRASDYDNIEVSAMTVNRCGIQLTGFFECFDNDRVQLVGKLETAYLDQFSSHEKKRKFDELCSKQIPCIIVCHGVEPMPECVESAREHNITLLSTSLKTTQIMVALVSFLKDGLADKITRHGVLIEVYGEGVFITGESGLGKSEAALELVKRGHRLVADDAVEIKKTTDTTLVGSAPELIRNFIEIRGIGVVDVCQIFGASAVKRSERIDLVVALEEWNENTQYDRIGADTEYTSILDVKVPVNRVPVRPGRNLAVIIEVAAMNNKQKRLGNNSGIVFNDRIDKFFAKQEVD